MAQKFRKIGVITSGGDAPGMNAAVRAITRAANARGVRVMGIYGGYRGMIHDEMIELTDREVSNKIQLSGTILYSDRCLRFKDPEGMKEALENCKEKEIDVIKKLVDEVYKPTIEDLKDGRLVTSGGRVLGVTATADTLGEAVAEAYETAGLIDFENAYYRHDIGERALSALEG